MGRRIDSPVWTAAQASLVSPFWGLRAGGAGGIVRFKQTPYPMETPVAALIERKGSTIHAVSPSITVAEAVAEMNKHRIGCLVVLEAGKITGIFTERDVLRRIVGEGRDPKTTILGDVMTRDVYTIDSRTSVEQTMVFFAEKRCRHLPIVESGKLLGLISIGDISRWVSDVSRAEAEHLKNYIAGGFPA
jgi:CBS domain-containing protein